MSNDIIDCAKQIKEYCSKTDCKDCQFSAGSIYKSSKYLPCMFKDSSDPSLWKITETIESRRICSSFNLIDKDLTDLGFIVLTQKGSARDSLDDAYYELLGVAYGTNDISPILNRFFSVSYRNGTYKVKTYVQNADTSEEDICEEKTYQTEPTQNEITSLIDQLNQLHRKIRYKNNPELFNGQ